MSSKLRKTLSRKKKQLLASSVVDLASENQDIQKLNKRVELLSNETLHLKIENSQLLQRVSVLEAEMARIKSRLNMTSYNAYEVIDEHDGQNETKEESSHSEKMVFVSLDTDNQLKRAKICNKKSSRNGVPPRSIFNLEWYRSIRRRIQLSFSRQV